MVSELLLLSIEAAKILCGDVEREFGGETSVEDAMIEELQWCVLERTAGWAYEYGWYDKRIGRALGSFGQEAQAESCMIGSRDER
jgi:hypothetical protein